MLPGMQTGLTTHAVTTFFLDSCRYTGLTMQTATLCCDRALGCGTCPAAFAFVQQHSKALVHMHSAVPIVVLVQQHFAVPV
jgi:hypothetical protein